ncbi:MAG: hypothetical protein LW689_04400 [Novosphingobium sp.]|nr:hypothetical protein [Novosphingobium sp.]
MTAKKKPIVERPTEQDLANNREAKQDRFKEGVTGLARPLAHELAAGSGERAACPAWPLTQILTQGAEQSALTSSCGA